MISRLQDILELISRHIYFCHIFPLPFVYLFVRCYSQHNTLGLSYYLHATTNAAMTNLHDGTILYHRSCVSGYSDRTSCSCAWRFCSATFFCSSTARAFISCLLGEVSGWMYHIHLLQMSASSFSFFFVLVYCPAPLAATRCVIAWEIHSHFRIQRSLIPLSAQIIS